MMPIVNIFATPFEDIKTHLEVAVYIAKTDHNEHIKLKNHINHVLDKSIEYKCWQNAMPTCIPTILSKYQRDYGKYIKSHTNFLDADKEINKNGIILPQGQILFRGSAWCCESAKIITQKPISTTLCPHIAIMEAKGCMGYHDSYYDKGYIDICVIRIVDHQTKAFIFKPRRTKLGHEKEVLLGSGVTLEIRSRNLVSENFTLSKSDPINIGTTLSKQGCIYVTEVDAY
ncbi:MAG: hypothetical protein LBV04_08125 [Deferribacteraceae bacterium]|jgi:hypothetical protein|nr:hypothetical protein [Deferribacteraceae bacterium]